MGKVVEFPKQDKQQQEKPLAAVIPDVVFEPLRGLTLTVDPALLDEIRAEGYFPLIVPVHDIDGEIDVAAHAYIRISFDYIHASASIKQELDNQGRLQAVKDYIERLERAPADLGLVINQEVGNAALDVSSYFNPRVLIVPDLRDNKIRLSRRFTDALRLGSKVIPVIASGVAHLDKEMDYSEAAGIHIPGSSADYHPRHYDETVDRPHRFYDHDRDELVKASVKKAYAEDLPLFGICSGMQGIVLFGDENGRLIPDLKAMERGGHFPTSAKRTREDFQAVQPSVLIPAGYVQTGEAVKPQNFKAAHTVKFASGSFFTHLLSLTFKFKAADQVRIDQGFEIPVNSLHQQAIDPESLSGKLSIDGVAEDGTIEAVHSRKHKYIVGVQFHPEVAFMKGISEQHPLEMALYRALFWSFGQALSDKMWRKIIARAGKTGNWRNRGMSRVYMTVPGSIKQTPEFVTNGGFNGTELNPMPAPS